MQGTASLVDSLHARGYVRTQLAPLSSDTLGAGIHYGGAAEYAEVSKQIEAAV